MTKKLNKTKNSTTPKDVKLSAFFNSKSQEGDKKLEDTKTCTLENTQATVDSLDPKPKEAKRKEKQIQKAAEKIKAI